MLPSLLALCFLSIFVVVHISPWLHCYLLHSKMVWTSEKNEPKVLLDVLQKGLDRLCVCFYVVMVI